MRKSLIILTHGAGARDSYWFRPGGQFHDNMIKNFPNCEIIPFAWDQPFGGIFHNEIYKASKALKEVISEKRRGRNLIIVAHSYGGLMASMAINNEALNGCRLVTLGTPFYADKQFCPDLLKLETHYNIFSIGDKEQSKVSDRIPVYSPDYREFYGGFCNRGGKHFHDSHVKTGSESSSSLDSDSDSDSDSNSELSNIASGIRNKVFNIQIKFNGKNPSHNGLVENNLIPGFIRDIHDISMFSDKITYGININEKGEYIKFNVSEMNDWIRFSLWRPRKCNIQ